MVVVVGHIWNVCKVSGIRAMPSHVNNQKLQPRFQRVSGHTPLTCVAFTFIRPIGPAIAGDMRRGAVRVRAHDSRVYATRGRIPDRRSFIAPRVAPIPPLRCLITRASNWRIPRRGEQLLRGGRRRYLFPGPLLAVPEKTPRAVSPRARFRDSSC